MKLTLLAEGKLHIIIGAVVGENIPAFFVQGVIDILQFYKLIVKPLRTVKNIADYFHLIFAEVTVDILMFCEWMGRLRQCSVRIHTQIFSFYSELSLSDIFFNSGIVKIKKYNINSIYYIFI